MLYISDGTRVRKLGRSGARVELGHACCIMSSDFRIWVSQLKRATLVLVCEQGSANMSGNYFELSIFFSIIC